MTFQSITLTEAEMKALDDGQDWYEPGDVVRLAGYSDHQELGLSVNGTSHDNWTYRHELPPAILIRLEREG